MHLVIQLSVIFSLKPSWIGENANNFENCISVQQMLFLLCSNTWLKYKA